MSLIKILTRLYPFMSKLKQFVYALFTQIKKKAVTNFVTASFSLWTSLGLNQGPPDYESVALTN